MSAINRLRHQISDLTERYVDEDGDIWQPLLQQLLIEGPHMRASQEIVGKVQPKSNPPGNLDARDLYDRIRGEACTWAVTLAGHRVREHEAVALIPTLSEQVPVDDVRLHSREPFIDDRGVEHRAGLYATVGRWHRSTRVFLGFELRPSHYPTATCPECGYRDRWGGSIYSAGTVAWCAHRQCRDDRGFRTEWSQLFLLELLRNAITHADAMMVATAATGVSA